MNALQQNQTVIKKLENIPENKAYSSRRNHGTNTQQVKPSKVKTSSILGDEEFHKALLSLASVNDVSFSAVSLFSHFQQCSLEVSLTFN